MYQQALEFHPAHATVYNALALAYEGLGRDKEARPLHQKSIDLDLDKLGDDHSLACAYSRTGQLERAIEIWKRMIESDPNFADAYADLAIGLGRSERNQEGLEALFLSGNRESAMQQLEILNRLDPNFQGAMKKLLAAEKS